MATRKRSTAKKAETAAPVSNDAVVEAVQEEAKPDAVIDTSPAPNNSARPNDTPIDKPSKHFTQSTFAERAKAANKRVDKSDTESK
jgi:hypothetical protein